MDSASAGILRAAWARARAAAVAHTKDGAARLCAVADVPDHLYLGRNDDFCIDWPALTGLAADHSCSPSDLLTTVDSTFVENVMEVAERTELQLRQAKTPAERRDVWHSQHVNLQEADPQYLFRAQANGAHFQLPVAAGDPKAVSLYFDEYLARAAAGHAPANAIGLYLNYHVAALQDAQKASAGCAVAGDGSFSCAEFTPEQKAARDAAFAKTVSEEAFALHFLEDAFSSGHMLSPQGDDSKRMGTHDYYCEHGLLAQSWRAPRNCGDHCPVERAYVAHGDSFLDGAVDLPPAALAVASSLQALAAALRPGAAVPALDALHTAPDLDACKATMLPNTLTTALELPTVRAVLEMVPHPVVEPPGTGDYYKEFGPFYMPNASFSLRVDFRDLGGMAHDSYLARVPGRLDLGMGVGYTAGGITNTASDGVFWLTPAINVDARPPDSRVGMRLGAGLSAHIPFLVIPGDLLPLAIVLLFDRQRYLKWAIRAAGGGAFGLERKHRIGQTNLQVVLGREASFNYMPKAPHESNRPFISFSGRPGYWQLVLPVVVFNNLHASDAHVGLDTMWQVGYDLTRYLDAKEGAQGGVRGKLYHGIFLSYGFQARRYPLSVTAD